MAPQTTTQTESGIDALVSGSVARLDVDALRETFREQGGVVVIDDLVPPDLVDRFVTEARALSPEVHRNYVPGQKQGGSVSRFSIDRAGAGFGDLYRSRALRSLLDGLSGHALLDCRPRDAHTYALYFYSQPGDHIGWHFDTSFYRGKRYTMLLGLVDNESCHLECELHKRDAARTPEKRVFRTKPGSAIFFDGDSLWHRVTPLAEGDSERIVLTFEFVTDARMNPWRRLVSDVKDAVAYFGFRDVFFPPRRPQPTS
jgi:hypothetical protein